MYDFKKLCLFLSPLKQAFAVALNLIEADATDSNKTAAGHNNQQQQNVTLLERIFRGGENHRKKPNHLHSSKLEVEVEVKEQPSVTKREYKKKDFVIEELAACILIMIVAYITTALTAEMCSRDRDSHQGREGRRVER